MLSNSLLTPDSRHKRKFKVMKKQDSNKNSSSSEKVILNDDASVI